MRLLVLTLGPPIIVAVSYCLTMLDGDKPTKPELRAAGSTITDRPALTATTSAQLNSRCQEEAASVKQRIDSDCQMIVRPPYILAGDFDVDQLERYHRLLVVPIACALSTDYFDTAPVEPITILFFSGDQTFREHARRLDQRSAMHEYGYYHRADRRIVINAATGNGTLAHELTHALARVDFPHIPPWFDEGLAALHEQCEFSDDGLRLNGMSNWRLNVLRDAIQHSRLHSIETLMSKPAISPERADIDYAHARYFCLYLQSRRLLSPFYRKFRQAAAIDPTGIDTLRELLQTDSLKTTDKNFRRWVLGLETRTSTPPQ
ncbi:MAG: hypothetical protein HOL01_23415 [Planctomycetaceae bacterium]|jgi:hypothetical protein|nr:hypothetical protein [Planctomycetaceae bacterium]MBT6488055.1 hypothetical protein [Planctomycetaceae bacterium]MBT6497471.1 hypothetical protein [Planctomycetaceae bacterium]